MNLTLRAILNSIAGLAIGVGVVFMIILLSLAFTFTTEDSARIPGVISIWATTENDAIALNFEPDFPGIGILVLVIALLYAITASALWHRRKSRKEPVT
jgi:hypothetical protein